MQFLYFASVREAMGRDGEELQPPEHVTTIADAANWLAGQSEAHAAALENHGKLRFALDHVMTNKDASIANACELAIFPPVTGG